MKANAIKSNKKIIPLLCISSLIFIVFASFLLASGVNYKNKGIKTYAVITRIETERRAANEDVTHYVYVKFEAEGRIIEGRLYTYVAGMREGQKIPIRYMPDNPRDFTYAKGMFLIPVLLYIVSAVMLLFIIMYRIVRMVVKTRNSIFLRFVNQETSTSILKVVMTG